MADIPKSSQEIEVILGELADRLCREVTSWEDVVFIGIRSGGDYVAEHVVQRIQQRCGANPPRGTLDIALYRDDLSRRLFSPEVRRTEIPFSLDDKEIILVDDVLNTGRSVRAAIDHIVDLGRPKRIRLLVFFDRGGRELPIQADFIGRHIELEPSVVIKLNEPEDGSVGGVTISEVPR